MILRLAVLGLFLLGATARADEWKTPTQVTLVSPDQHTRAVISPGVSGGDPPRADITAKKRTSFTLATPWMPVDAVLFDDGTLLTLDSWHELGHGTVATVYERDGKVRWA